MAANLIPLVLLGGGAAYVVTQKKKKKDKGQCPAEVKTTLGEAESAAQRAQAKHGEAASPFKEAEFFVKAIMPKGCGPSSYKTRIRATLDLPKSDKPVTVDLSATDVYMLALGQAIGRRLNTGKIKEHQAEKFWTDGLTWYKKTTGKEFDPNALGLEIFEDIEGFLKELAAGIKEAGAGWLGKKPKGEGSMPDDPMDGMTGGLDSFPHGCPPEYIFDVTPEILEKMDRTAQIAAAKTPDPYMVADAIFNAIVPKGCTKESKDTIIEIRNHTPDDLGVPEIMALPTFYAGLVIASIETIYHAGGFPQGDPEAMMDLTRLIHGSVNDWHMGVMGTPLPAMLQFENVDW